MHRMIVGIVDQYTKRNSNKRMSSTEVLDENGSRGKWASNKRMVCIPLILRARVSLLCQSRIPPLNVCIVVKSNCIAFGDTYTGAPLKEKDF